MYVQCMIRSAPKISCSIFVLNIFTGFDTDTKVQNSFVSHQEGCQQLEPSNMNNQTQRNLNGQKSSRRLSATRTKQYEQSDSKELEWSKIISLDVMTALHLQES
jgi:hypothetical protein